MPPTPVTDKLTRQSGIVVVDKPGGWSSHQAVARLRRLLGTRKVGHAGTLDPMATGVLVAGVERATRLLGHLALHDKRYLATIRLGISTVTDDAEGEVVEVRDASGLDEATVRAGVLPYLGEIQQVPSAVSAIKVAGQRSYARVRAGEDVQLKARTVTVTRYDVLDIRREGEHGELLDVDIDVECGSGTYIRALARDLGRDLGVGAHLTALRRTRVGPFILEEAVDIERDEHPPVVPMGDIARRCFTCLEVDEATAVRIRFGQVCDLTLPESPTALLGPTGDLLALYEPRDGAAKAVAVLA